MVYRMNCMGRSQKVRVERRLVLLPTTRILQGVLVVRRDSRVIIEKRGCGMQWLTGFHD